MASLPGAQKDYDKIGRLVQCYQYEKYEKCAHILLDLFEPMFNKYYLLATKQKAFYDQGARNFISAVTFDIKIKGIDDEIEMKKIVNMLAASYVYEPKEYIYSDMYAVFLNLLEAYCSSQGHFCQYISFAFPYRFGDLVKKKINNPTIYNKLTLGDYSNYIDKRIVQKDIDSLIDEIVDEHGYLTEKWSSSDKSGAEFQYLNHFEKKVLLMYYQDMMSDRQISELLNIHINTVNQKRRAAIQKIGKASGVSYTKKARSRNSGKKAIVLKEEG